MTEIDIDSQVKDAMRTEKMSPPEDPIVPDGVFHRYSSNGKYDKNCWYKIHADGTPAGSFGDFSQGLTKKWRLKTTQRMTAAERDAFRSHIETMRQERAQAEHARQEDAAAYASELLVKAKPANSSHTYCLAKQIQSDGLFVDTANGLLAPIYRFKHGAPVLSSLEYIHEDGSKQYLHHGLKRAGFAFIGDVEHAPAIGLGEGWATCRSVFEATGLPMVCAFDAQNLQPVAETLHQAYPTKQLVICGDDDLRTDPQKENTGRVAAMKAASAVQGSLAMPVLHGKKCDFNDMCRILGPDAVKIILDEALRPSCVLDKIHKYVGRFVVYPNEFARVAHVLWIAHTHLMEKWDSTPRLFASSPEPGSGKTRVLEVSEPLVPNPVDAVNVTVAYLFRKISDPAGPPTILFDEIDTVFPHAKENEELRGLLNAGHRKGAKAGRCVVKDKIVTTEELPAFCALAMAGLGALPATVLTRSVVIPMRRRAPTEQVEPFRARLHQPEEHPIRDELAVWAAKVGPSLNTCPELPKEITDRAADVWEPLIAVADAAGGEWPERARVAAVALVALAGEEGVSISLGVRLLTDIRTVFEDHASMTTDDLLLALIVLDESPWGDLRGKPLDSRRLAALLKPYGIKSKNLRMEKGVLKGYVREAFGDAWLRYLPHTNTLNEPYRYYKEENIGGASSPATSSPSADPPPPSVLAATSATPATSPETDELVFHVAGSSPLLPGVSAPTRSVKPKPVMNEAVYQNFVTWIIEREVIRQRRETNTPLRLDDDGLPVWTEDPVLQRGRFCNVERKRDAVSAWICRNIIGHFAADPFLFVQLSICRFINWPASILALIHEKVWPTPAWVDGHPNWTGMAGVVDAMKEREKAFNAAYRVPSVAGLTRAQAIFTKFLGQQLLTQQEAIQVALQSGRQHAVEHVLTRMNGWGPFLSAQVIVDCTYSALLPNPEDRDTWAAAGPGCIQGLNRLSNRPVKDPLLSRRPEQAIAELVRLRERLIADQVPLVASLSLMDLQNCSCEVDKFTRYINKEEKMHQLYRPRPAFVDIDKEQLP